MARCRADPAIERVEVQGFKFPLGSYPVEDMTPVAGFTVDFEPADTDAEDEQWEAWPDRYVFDVVISADRVEALVRSLMGLFPGRVYPILDVLGQDAFREVDPYVANELSGMDRVLDALRRYRAFFFEDGLVGFGVMTEEPFLYLFVDEHKIVTVRVEPAMKERVEKILQAFDLEATESAAGADSACHEHRGVLTVEEGRPDLLTGEEIVEQLRDDWALVLNIDPEANVDDDGKELGVTAWRALIRVAEEGDDRCRYVEVVLAAECLREAEDLALDAAESLRPKDVEVWDESVVVAADRLEQQAIAEFAQAIGIPPPESPLTVGIIWRGWLE
ncbi:MAG: hypothetical protein ACKVW3_05055 [Phycisphaerales bacterium]